MSATILVLEDDPALQALFCDVLEEEGHAVVAASDLPELLNLLPEQPDLLISDIMVDLHPVGLEAIDAVRGAYNQPVPAILCTAAANHVERFRDQIELRAAVVITKPFSIEGFLEVVNHALGSKALCA